MGVCIEITWRDHEVSRDLRRLVRASAESLDEYDDVVELCHVIINDHVHEGAEASGYAVSINLILREGHTVAACLPRQQRSHETIRQAVNEAFHELRRWLRRAAPRWRDGGEAAPTGAAAAGSDAPTAVADPAELLIAASPLQGSHYYVG